MYIWVGTINGERIAIDDSDKFKYFIEKILYVVSPSIWFMHSILDEDNLDVIFKEISKDRWVIKDWEIIASQSYHNDKIQRSCPFEDWVYTDPKGEDISCKFQWLNLKKTKLQNLAEKAINKVFSLDEENKRVSNEIGKSFNDLLNELILIFETSEDIKDTEFKIYDQFKISFEPYDEYNTYEFTTLRNLTVSILLKINLYLLLHGSQIYKFLPSRIEK